MCSAEIEIYIEWYYYFSIEDYHLYVSFPDVIFNIDEAFSEGKKYVSTHNKP